MGMNSAFFIPSSLRAAGRELRLALYSPIQEMPTDQFIRAWCSVAYLFPGLHPDAANDVDGGWPRTLSRFATEAWRRFEREDISEEVLYPSDAQWCGLYDRMAEHAPTENQRRSYLAEKFVS